MSKKQKESSPLGKTNQTEDDGGGDAEAMLQIETPAWIKHLLLEFTEVKTTVLQISDLRSELTKLTNSFISFKSDIQFRVNEMGKASSDFWQTSRILILEISILPSFRNANVFLDQLWLKYWNREVKSF